MSDTSEKLKILPEAVSRILRWYPVVRRILPWRQNPTPYHTWIAEIMLQQTRIEAVIPYYTRFLKELPDIQSLAVIPDDRLLKLWEGLGYYSRARNLKKAAVLLMEQNGGSFPASAAELRKLPGIGEYTAGAIASIAFGLPEPAVDGNVLRVITRLLACGEDISDPKTKRFVKDLLRLHYPEGYENREATGAIYFPAAGHIIWDGETHRFRFTEVDLYTSIGNMYIDEKRVGVSGTVSMRPSAYPMRCIKKNDE